MSGLSDILKYNSICLVEPNINKTNQINIVSRSKTDVSSSQPKIPNPLYIEELCTNKDSK